MPTHDYIIPISTPNKNPAVLLHKSRISLRDLGGNRYPQGHQLGQKIPAMSPTNWKHDLRGSGLHQVLPLVTGDLFRVLSVTLSGVKLLNLHHLGDQVSRLEEAGMGIYAMSHVSKLTPQKNTKNNKQPANLPVQKNEPNPKTRGQYNQNLPQNNQKQPTTSKSNPTHFVHSSSNKLCRWLL